MKALSLLVLVVLLFTLSVGQAGSALNFNFFLSNPTTPPAVLLAPTTGSGIVFHDAVNAYQEIKADLKNLAIDVGMYQEGPVPWIDLLVQMSDGKWYGPERDAKDTIQALPLPPGYHWVVTEGFGALPNGEVWFVGPKTEAWAVLYGPGEQELHRFPFRVELPGQGHEGPGAPSWGPRGIPVLPKKQ
jgi:hypothetical protein